MLPPIFIINLEQSIERKNKLINQLKKQNISNYYIFEAINGYTSNISVPQKSIYFHKSLSPGSIGNVLSFINVFNIIKFNKIKEAIIFEDDVDICDNFIERYNNIINQVPEDWNHLFLGCIVKELGQQISTNIFKSQWNCLGTHSFVIKYSIINKLIHNFSKINGTTDEMIANMIEQNEIISYVVNPYLTFQNDPRSVMTNAPTKNEILSLSKKFFKK